MTSSALADAGARQPRLPKRRSPVHDWLQAQGALFESVAGWDRPAVYLRRGEKTEQAVQREARAVRTQVGLLDSSSLGRIEICGPGALDFLDRLHMNDLKSLRPGHVRYGLMLRETGVIFAETTLAMLAPDKVLLTTQCANAGQVQLWLEEWHQCEFPDLRVALTQVTDQWATLVLAGPRARTVLSKLHTRVDLSREAFPHLAVREGRLLGYPTRICRVSLTGELTYEISVPANAGPGLWEELMEAGSGEGLQPFGMAALAQLRLEKGFIEVGADTDSSTVPQDVGWEDGARGKAQDFVGKPMLTLPRNLNGDRLRLVGLAAPRRSRLMANSEIRLTDSIHSSDGWITSAAWETSGHRSIALALLRGGSRHTGSTVTVHTRGAPETRAEVVSLPIYDASGDRMHA
jgi:sarcosine oxidase subunit alpha